MLKDSQLGIFLRIEKSRLYPSLTDPNYLVLRARRLNFIRWIGSLPAQGLHILDVGGRYQPYRALFQNRTARFVAIDIRRTELVDVIASGEALPFAANTFDVVIATQVFEYFSRPHDAAVQIHNILKPGGCLFLSVASFVPRFVDEELWRFTEPGLRSMLAGFSKVEIVAETYSPGGLIRSLSLGLLFCLRLPALRRLGELSFVPLLNLLGRTVEGFGLTTNDQFAPNYSVLAVK